MNTVDHCQLYDDFQCYFGIVQLFPGHSIDMVHSCTAMLPVQTI